MAGAGPNIGTEDITTSTPPTGGGGGAGLESHTESGSAHPASAITTDGHPETVPVSNVEDAIDALAGALPPEPPKLGFQHSHLEFTGIPDWGSLKLLDSSLLDRGVVTSANAAADMFPYYYVAPSPALDTPEFPVLGADPQTDVLFNSGLAITGGFGPGNAFAGGYTRPPGGPDPVPVIPTSTIIDREGSAKPVVVSGALYPADRGVLAVLHWPAGGDTAAFLAQPLLDRCPFAILLGRGILDADAAGVPCDGDAGGIFTLGTDPDGNYDPFVFPGQATGQYDLLELYLGTSLLDGSTLPAPFDDYDQDTVAGAKRVPDAPLPSPGQVRLGTDPNAGETPLTYGIPILGSHPDMYDPPPGATIGDAALDTGNFFRYRLPYLDDYSQATGLKYTPSGQPGTELTTKEKFRFFSVPTDPLAFPPNTGVPKDVTGAVTEIDQAGNFPDFPKDHYPWQIARFRQAFFLKHTGGGAVFEEHGTYFLVHFKKEKDFEAFVRDGVEPDDPTDGYEVYSAYFIPGSTGIDELDRKVNDETSTAVPAPAGPAPDYGYSALTYHNIRANIFEDPDDHLLASGDFTTTDSTFISASTPGVGFEWVVWVSGVSYFTPRDHTTGLSGTNLTVEFTASGFWTNSFRTDDRQLSGALADTAPALLSSPCPAFLGLAPFSFGDVPGAVSYLHTTGAAPGAYAPSDAFLRQQRLEIPYTHLGSNGTGVFSSTNGPLAGDSMDIPSGPLIEFAGDDRRPSFSADAKVRAYFRRPFNHYGLTPTDTIRPYTATDGHGIVGVDTGGDIILFHSTNFNLVAPLSNFGNFRTGGAAPTVAYATLAFPIKDYHDQFLDEVYRYGTVADDIAPAGPLDALYGAGAEAAIEGPGIGGWVSGPIETPIRIGHVPGASVWQAVSFVQNDEHLTDLGGTSFLQVAGLPDRNPPITDGNLFPFPSAGVLLYPHKDYSSGYIPGAGVHIASVQPDYSAAAGRRSYTRVLDMTVFTAVAAAGDRTAILRIDGLQLQDYAYSAPGPGDITGTSGIAILVKIPGLTTWMDIGRTDGDGPSKQDPALDGAGCQVVGPDTYDAVDSETGMVYSHVKIHVGPTAALFAMTGLHGASGIDAADVGKVPLMVQVRMDPAAAAFNLEDEYDPGSKTFAGSPGPGIESAKVRGLVGIRAIDPAAL